MSEAKVTTDHAEIRRWAEQRGGHPATVKATSDDGHAGILRLDFDPKDDSLKDVPWEEFFRKFDGEKLAFLHQDKHRTGSSAASTSSSIAMANKAGSPYPAVLPPSTGSIAPAMKDD